MDIRRQPDKILEATEALVPDIANAALTIADPMRASRFFCVDVLKVDKSKMLKKDFDTHCN